MAQAPLVQFVTDLLCSKSTTLNVPKCCGLLSNISTILVKHDDKFDVLAARCTTAAASGVAILQLHNAAPVCSSKRTPIADTKFYRRH